MLRSPGSPPTKWEQMFRVASSFAYGRATLALIAAHMDEIGCIVKSVEPGGFLRLDRSRLLLAKLLFDEARERHQETVDSHSHAARAR